MLLLHGNHGLIGDDHTPRSGQAIAHRRPREDRIHVFQRGIIVQLKNLGLSALSQYVAPVGRGSS